MRAVPSEDDAKRCVTAKFSKSVSTLPRYLHRGTAGNMEPLTGGGAGMIRWVDRWLLILVRRYFKKISGRGFQKARFRTLDDDSHAEKIFWRWCHFASIFT